jgi:prepilin-type N-terminal cleavage/methylation domain-containing protein
MDRSLNTSEGFTLLELLIALALGSVILLTASNFLVNYAKFSSNVIKSEASLMQTSLAVFEEIVDKLSASSKAVCGAEAAMDVPATARPGGCLTDGTCVQIRCDTISSINLYQNTPSVFSDDTVYTYWLNGTDLHKKVDGAVTIGDTVIAQNINTFSVYRVDNTNSASPAYLNTIRVVLGVQASSGTTSGVLKEYLDTTVEMREKSLN